MSSQNLLNPLCGCVGSCNCGSGSNTMLIERLIGNAYEVVKFVAYNMTNIRAIAAYITAMQSTVASVTFTDTVTRLPWTMTFSMGTPIYTQVAGPNPAVPSINFFDPIVGQVVVSFVNGNIVYTF